MADELRQAREQAIARRVEAEAAAAAAVQAKAALLDSERGSASKQERRAMGTHICVPTLTLVLTPTLALVVTLVLTQCLFDGRRGGPWPSESHCT